MPDRPARYAVNASILFTELPLDRRPAAVRAAGFDAVEFWWPYPEAVPADAAIDAFERSISSAGVNLVGLNFFAGDMPGGDRGIVSWPDRSGEFRDNVEVVVGIGERLGCRVFNALYGNRIDGATAAEQDDLAVENLAFAARAAARIGGVVVVEPLSGAARYPLRSARDAVAVIERVAAATGLTNLALLADLYHLATNGADLDAVIAAYHHRIGHVQIADVPRRTEPGSGTLPIGRHLAALAEVGYDGWIGLEYRPTGASADSFGWLPRRARGSARA